MNSLLFHSAFGSHIYGTNLPSSDKDFKAIFIPDSRSILLGQVKDAYNETTKTNIHDKNTSDDEETEFFSLKKFLLLLCQGQTVALDMLFCPQNFILFKNAIWDEIIAHKDKWLSTQITASTGYIRTQVNKYGIKGSRVAASRAACELFDKLIQESGHRTKCKDHWGQIEEFAKSGVEHVSILQDKMRGNDEYKVRMLDVCGRKIQEHITLKEAYKIFKMVFDEYGQRALQAETNQNIDWKACMHAVRVCNQTVELLTTGHVTFPRPEAEYLKQIRQGMIPYKEVAELIESGLASLTVAKEKSVLRAEPDYDFMNDFVYSVYKNAVQLE